MTRAPVWMLLGPELGLKDDFIRNLKAEALKAGDVDEFKWQAQEKDPGDLVSELRSGSLFGSSQFVVYSGIETLRLKQDIETLADYCRKPSLDCVLCLVSESPQADAALKTAVPQDNQKIFWEMFDDQKENWIRAFFRKEGVGIDEDAVETILELVENNTQALKVECSRLALFAGAAGRVTDSDVETYIAHNREEDAFSLFARMATGTVEQAFETLSRILYSKESEPVAILAGLAWSFRRLRDMEKLRLTLSEDQAFLRSGIKSKGMQAMYRAASRRWPPEACERIVASCVDADAAARSGGQALSVIALEAFVYSSMVKGGRPPEKSAYEYA